MKGRALVAATTVIALTTVVAGVANAGTDVGAPGIQVSTPSPAAFTSYGGIRLRAIGSLANTADEYLGVADLAPAANRIESNFTVPRFVTNMNSGSASGDCIGNYEVGTLATPAANQITLAWDQTAGILTSRLVNQSLDCTLVFRNFAQELANAEGWTLARAQSAVGDINALRVMIDGRQTGSGIVLRGVTVDGTVPLGPFNPGSGSRQDWLGSGYDFDAPNGFNVSGSLDLGGSFATCEDTCALEIKFGHVPPLNRAPVVQDHAPDVTGLEGDTLATDGSFTDPDGGDALTISGAGTGSVTDHGDGRWSWRHVPPDDGNGTVTVTASDGNGGTATDVFSWRADNVPPTIVSLTPSTTTALAGSDVTWTATATDPGTADTFIWSFDGGAGSAGGLTTTYTRSYASCGTYALDARVADDDGGSDSATSHATVSVGEGVVLPPLGSGKDLVQTGQVVPVKVRIGCGGAFWGGLAPAITLVHGDETYPAASVAAVDQPGVMRELDGMYLYNLRIPSSVGSHDLVKGDEVTIRVEPLGPAGGALDVVVQIRK
ncbi:MAG: PKD domain-containing protein [Actinomycetota bacterium]|nr:PKD domain-containing protein [Actinomycetota bacterium]